jgi:plasmid stabilization system protein ParE
MAYQVNISPTAIADIEKIYLYLQEEAQVSADQWVIDCFEAMFTLESFPRRCPLAQESQDLGLSIHQLLYSSSHRILYTVTGDSENGYVQIHRVRGAKQDKLQNVEELLG